MSTFDQRLADWFEGRRWRVMDELTGEAISAGVKITYSRGSFEIEPPGVFVTPIGHRGRRGFIIQEAGEDGRVTADSRADSRAAFGEATLRRAAAKWGLVTGLPEES